jgi:hypothetical protein
MHSRTQKNANTIALLLKPATLVLKRCPSSIATLHSQNGPALSWISIESKIRLSRTIVIEGPEQLSNSCMPVHGILVDWRREPDAGDIGQLPH